MSHSQRNKISLRRTGASFSGYGELNCTLRVFRVCCFREEEVMGLSHFGPDTGRTLCSLS
jgi:hypothetical protein